MRPRAVASLTAVLLILIVCAMRLIPTTKKRHPKQETSCASKYARGVCASWSARQWRIPRYRRVEHTLPIEVHDTALLPEECMALIQIAGPLLHQSMLLSGQGTSRYSSRRKSLTAFLPDDGPFIESVRRRVAKILSADPKFVEALQVVFYQEGMYFGEHYDLVKNEESIEERGQRAKTAFVYLNDRPEGNDSGSTEFPEQSVKIQPKRGRAVLWSNLTKRGENEYRTVHRGNPVWGWKKWGLNVWARTKPQR